MRPEGKEKEKEREGAEGRGVDREEERMEGKQSADAFIRSRERKRGYDSSDVFEHRCASFFSSSRVEARSISERRDNCLAAEKTAGRIGRRERDTTRWDEVAIFRRLLTD